MRTDPELKQAVLHELQWDTRVRETEVGVQVDDGTVTLTGTVDSWGKRAAAEAAAHRVDGVLDVANDLRVRLPGDKTRTDTDLAKAIRHALIWDVLVPGKRIRTTVSDGWVTLEGQVESWTQREDAEKAVRNLVGVRVLVNHLEIKPEAYAGDVRTAIIDALSRHAGRTAQHIEIEVHDGCVQLRGCVASKAEKDAAIGAAMHAPGVRSIDDQLRIRVPPTRL